MTDAEILDKLNIVFREILGDDVLTLTRETTAQDVENWDSFNHVNIIVATEMEYGVSFQTAEIEGMRNVGSLMDLIKSKKGWK